MEYFDEKRGVNKIFIGMVYIHFKQMKELSLPQPPQKTGARY